MLPPLPPLPSLITAAAAAETPEAAGAVAAAAAVAAATTAEQEVLHYTWPSKKMTTLLVGVTGHWSGLPLGRRPCVGG